MRVLIADDHAILREGLALLVNQQPDMEVVGQAHNGLDAVELATTLKPDIAILDVSMPRLGGPEAAEQIREKSPHVKVLALTRHSDQGYMRRLLRAGAAGYVLKKSAADTLINAIRIVAAGGQYVEPQMAAAMQRSGATATTEGSEALSAREEEVLRSIAWGRSNKEIAADLGLSTKTVESYRAAATDKLRLHSRADIVRYAVSRGWLASESGPE